MTGDVLFANVIGTTLNASTTTSRVCLDSITRDTIVSVWVRPAIMGDERGISFHTLGGAGGLVAKLRAQILAGGLTRVSAFRRKIRDAAIGSAGIGGIDQDTFQAAASLGGAELTVNIWLA